MSRGLTPVEKLVSIATSIVTAAVVSGCRPEKPVPSCVQGGTPLHTISTGETLESIAKKYGLTVGGLQQVTNVNDVQLVQGAQICIKSDDMGEITPTPAPLPTGVKNTPTPDIKQAVPTVADPIIEAQATEQVVETPQPTPQTTPSQPEMIGEVEIVEAGKPKPGPIETKESRPVEIIEAPSPASAVYKVEVPTPAATSNRVALQIFVVPPGFEKEGTRTPAPVTSTRAPVAPSLALLKPAPTPTPAAEPTPTPAVNIDNYALGTIVELDVNNLDPNGRDNEVYRRNILAAVARLAGNEKIGPNDADEILEKGKAVRVTLKGGEKFDLVAKVGPITEENGFINYHGNGAPGVGLSFLGTALNEAASKPEAAEAGIRVTEKSPRGKALGQYKANTAVTISPEDSLVLQNNGDQEAQITFYVEPGTGKLNVFAGQNGKVNWETGQKKTKNEVKISDQGVIAEAKFSMKRDYRPAVSRGFANNILWGLIRAQATSQGQKIDNLSTAEFNQLADKSLSGTISWGNGEVFDFVGLSGSLEADTGYYYDFINPGDGVCHSASLIYEAMAKTNSSGYDITFVPTIPHDTVGLIEGVEEKYQISIFTEDKRQNLVATNTSGKNLAINFEYDHKANTLSIKVVEQEAEQKAEQIGTKEKTGECANFEVVSPVGKCGIEQLPVQFGRPSETTLKGVDVSEYQGKVDWEKLKANGFHLAYIRAFHTYPDAKFKQNLAECRAAGITCAPYFFLSDNFSPQDQVKIFQYLYNPQAGDLIPAVDLELDRVVVGKNATKKDADRMYEFIAQFEAETGEKLTPILNPSYSRVEVTQRALKFTQLYEEATGIRPMIYTGKWYIDGHMNTEGQAGEQLSRHPFWISTLGANNPAFPKIAKPWDRIGFHQYGQLPKGHELNATQHIVDVDVFPGTEKDLKEYLTLGEN